MRSWPIRPTAAGRPARPFGPPATSRRSSRCRCRARCRAGSHPRLRHRPHGRHGQVPGGLPDPDQRLGNRQLRPLVPALPAARALHHRQGWPHHPRPPHEDELRAARRRATTCSFQESYRRWRPMVERSIAWLVADGCRRVPYRGIGRNDLWWSLRVAAVNLRRLSRLLVRGGPVPRDGRPGRPRRPRGPSRRTRRRAGRLP